MSALLPPVRRIVTGHDAAGKAIVASDTLLESTSNPSGSRFTLVWTSTGLPVDNDDTTDGRDRNVGLTLPGGSVIRVVDMPPGTVAPMHRTNSLDYGIVISGAIELIVEKKVTASIEPGGIIVQRGTNHSWRNPSADAVARVAFVLLDAMPATVDGQPLPEIHPAAGIRPEL